MLSVHTAHRLKKVFVSHCMLCRSHESVALLQQIKSAREIKISWYTRTAMNLKLRMYILDKCELIED